MPLLPLRALPVNDAHGGPFGIRVDMRPTHAAVYVRCESDNKIWTCKVSSIQQILPPSQEARALDVMAVITCLYHGVGYDATSLYALSAGAPLELTRREVAFTQPETWSDGNYRLTTRIALRSNAASVAAPMTPTAMAVASVDSAPDHIVPVVELPDEDIVFGLNFAPSNANIELLPVSGVGNEHLCVCMRLLSATFANGYLNWVPSPNPDFVRSVRDGLYIHYTKNGLDAELTLDLVHTSGPVLCVVSVGAHLIKPTHSTTVQAGRHSGDVFHTVLQFSEVRLLPRDVIQVTLLHGSSTVLGGTTLTLRELQKISVQQQRDGKYVAVP